MKVVYVVWRQNSSALGGDGFIFRLSLFAGKEPFIPIRYEAQPFWTWW
jgi:hypothetical protein